MQGLTVSLEEVFQKAIRLRQEGKLVEAAGFYRFCLEKSPNYSNIWTHYGALLRQQRRFLPAVGALERAYELEPEQEGVISNLAHAYCDVGRFDAAVALRRVLWARKPADMELLRGLTRALRGAQQHREVIDLVDQAEAAGGPLPGLRLQRAMSKLMLGDYAGGFADFECRFQVEGAPLPKDSPWPKWEGEDLDGKSIVVLPEQGFGDCILAARFLPGLKALGPKVTMVARPPLRRLFSHLPGLDELRAKVDERDQFDFYTPSLSLAHFIGCVAGRPPPPTKLAVAADSRHRAAEITAPFQGRFKIGVVWTGSHTNPTNPSRSTRPENFLEIAKIPGVQLFSLYKGTYHQAFLDSGMPGLIVDACINDRDFSDTAALIDEMDLMITTDTAVVHVAASRGKPVWNLLSREGFWLYGLGAKTPWYPSMRVFRQKNPGDWPEVFKRVAKALRARLSAVA